MIRVDQRALVEMGVEGVRGRIAGRWYRTGARDGGQDRQRDK